MKQYDNTYLSKNTIFTTNKAQTGLNNNEIVLGGTGTGKTMSCVIPKLLHANYSNYIVPVSKRILVDRYKIYLKSKGYTIYDLNLSDGYTSEVGFNPLDYIYTDKDMIWLATSMIDIHGKGEEPDPYWTETAISVLAAEIAAVMKVSQRNITLKELIDFHNSILIKENRAVTVTNKDHIFEQLEELYPDSIAIKGWKTLKGNSFKTASNIFSMVHNRLNKVYNEEILALSEKHKQLQINDLVKEKTILFITTSPIDLNLQNYVNIIYSILFKELFKIAEQSPIHQLETPIKFICDDFAVGSKIPKFEHYISMFREYEISVTILLQSETQLESMYGIYAASTILNNCDTLVYTGGMDLKTQDNMSHRVDQPMSEIQILPLDSVIICRRGNSPVFDKRYPTTQDIKYIEAEHAYLASQMIELDFLDA